MRSCREKVAVSFLPIPIIYHVYHKHQKIDPDHRQSPVILRSYYAGSWLLLLLLVLLAAVAAAAAANAIHLCDCCTQVVR